MKQVAMIVLAGACAFGMTGCGDLNKTTIIKKDEDRSRPVEVSAPPVTVINVEPAKAINVEPVKVINVEPVRVIRQEPVEVTREPLIKVEINK